MTQIKTVQVVCDGDECTAAYSASHEDLDSYPAQRKQARLDGWTCTSGNIDYCPECTNSSKEGNG